MEFCVWCQQPVYSGPWGHGNGKKLYVREEKGFKDVGAVHYYCIEKFQTMFRHTYIRFLDDYTAFVNDLNKRFRSEDVNLPGDVGTVTESAFRPMYADRPKEL